jgi:hypothetical protein
MEFTSQICTTRSQSKRLLALGLKKETADMTYLNDEICAASYNEMECPYDNLVKPAWSLHRLIEMCPLIPNPSRFLAVTSFKTVYVRMNDEMDVCYAGKGTYNNLIDCIEWLIKEGYFNKEYLEERV